MKYKNILYLTFITIGAILTACSSDQPAESTSQEISELSNDNIIVVRHDQFKANAMKMARLTDFDFTHKIKATGVIDVAPKDQVAVSAYYGGYIKSVQLVPGKYVELGQLLFTLENPDFIQMQQDYLESKGQLEFLKLEYERQQTLQEENIVSQKKFLKAKSDYQITLARCAALEKKLDLINLDHEKITAENLTAVTSVYAPISGYITEINISRGMFLNSDKEALQITNTEHLVINLNIFEKDFPSIREGQSLVFSIPDAQDIKYDAEIFSVGKTIISENRMVNVHAHLTNQEIADRLAPGMYIEAQILTNHRVSKALPEQAVILVDNQSYILIKKSSNDESIQFIKRLVEVGIKAEGMIEILNHQDFDPKTEILTIGAFNLIQ